METDSRPQVGQRNSSQSASRGNLRTKNTSSKNLTKLGKFSAVHGGAKVSMPRNNSKTNLRKNQSETSLSRHNTQTATPNSSHNARSGGSMSKDVSDTLQMTSNSSNRRRPAGNSEPKADPVPAYTPPQLNPEKSKPVQQKPSRTKKRSSKDYTASGGKKSRDQQFDFDGDEVFDDEAWEDENVEIVKPPNVAPRSPPPDDEPRPLGAHQVQDDELPVDEIESKFQGLDATNIDSVQEQRRVSFSNSENENMPLAPQIKQPTTIQFNLDYNEPSYPPASHDEPNPSPSHLERDIQAALHGSQTEVDVAQKADQQTSGQASSPTPPSTTNITFKVESPTKSPESITKKADAIAASDSDTSRETVVLASQSQQAPSALKATPTSGEILADSPTSKRRLPKKVQIEEPEEPEEPEDRDASTPSTGPTTPAIPADTTSSTPRTTSFTSVPQYEFLSKSQRDRASTMIQHHPYPPSAWRDNFLNRATPYVNDIHSEYTQKFARRLDRRIDIQLKNVMQFQDPIINAIHRGQENGVIAAFEQDESASDVNDANRYAAGGIGSWFLRLGGSGRRDLPKPSNKERLEAEQLERWERLVDYHDWEEAKSAKRSTVESRPLSAETGTTAE